MGKEFMEPPPFSNATAISLTLNGTLSIDASMA
jgi:hypothetical protein